MDFSTEEFVGILLDVAVIPLSMVFIVFAYNHVLLPNVVTLIGGWF